MTGEGLSFVDAGLNLGRLSSLEEGWGGSKKLIVGSFAPKIYAPSAMNLCLLNSFG